jgi:TonB family protein
MKSAYVVALFASFGVANTTAVVAQTSTPSSATSLPTDPSALLRLAAQVNGLHGLDRKPWHLHATFQVLDDKKQPVDSGTVEEWWVADGKYKIELNSRRFQQTRYVVAGRSSVSGDQTEPVFPFNLIIPALLNPLPSEGWIAAMDLTQEQTNFENQELACIVAHAPGVSETRDSSEDTRFCLQGSPPVIRMSMLGSREYHYDSVASFGGCLVAHDVHILLAGKLTSEVDVHVDSLDDLGPMSIAAFTPPLAASRSGNGLPIDANVIAGLKISGAVPKYPKIAKIRHIQGTVVLRATIGKDGTIGNLEVVSGPPELEESSVEAVKTWRYKPYLLNGEPVEVETQINVTYALGH